MRLPPKYDGIEFRLRRSSAKFRVLPDFLIIGAQKAGTTSLYRHLSEHPHVSPSFEKEVRYFNNHFDLGEAWYRAHFPTRLYQSLLALRRRGPVLTGEGEPSYLAHPLAPGRVMDLVPGVQLIVMLRNPVDRAYSHYQHRATRGRESRTFDEVIAADKEALKDGWDGLPLGDGKRLGHSHYSYLPRGLYHPQLKSWLAVFPLERFHIIRAEDMFADTQAVYDETCDFLELPRFRLQNRARHNAGTYNEPMPQSVRADLEDFFRPHNEKLESLLNRTFDWYS